jgi:Ser/Thr protein kinase RdoA (MazF antagonist)
MVEAAWMAALRRDAGVATPGVYLATDGSPVVWARHPTVPGRRAAMLFEWINGRPLYQVMTESRAQQLGTLSARLHQHASTSALPSPPSVLIADRVLYWRVDDRLSELAPMYGSLFTEAHARAQDAVDTLWRNPPHRPHLVHGDLSGSNVIVRRDRLVAIDFQDLVWGLDIQDLAITLTSLRRFDDCEHLIASLRCGYEAVRPWPDPDPSLLAALIAGRRLHQLNLTLNLRRPGYEQAIARAAALIRDWMAVPV